MNKRHLPMAMLAAAGIAFLPSVAKERKPKQVRQDVRERVRDLNNSREDVDTSKLKTLNDIVVTGSRNNKFNMESAHIGALSMSRSVIARTPTLLGESDIVKTLQLEPGVSAGISGFSGLYVHGGNVDENMYMLDGVPLYQVNHLGGLFSAFNTETIKNADFYKSTFPARFDGKLSSYIDIQTRDGEAKGYHGSFKLGLTSGALNIEGPLGSKKTTFSLALRRSWFDIVSRPLCYIMSRLNSFDNSDISMGYAFTDFNAKVTHRFSPTNKIYAEVYWGDDYLLTKQKTRDSYSGPERSETHINLRWGNTMALVGWNYEYTPNLRHTVTGSFSHYKSKMDLGQDYSRQLEDKTSYIYKYATGTDNFINDYRLNGDFNWLISDDNKLNFGATATIHRFLPMNSFQETNENGKKTSYADNIPTYLGTEFNAYVEDNLNLSDKTSISGGLHYSLFKVMGRENKMQMALSPRASINYTPKENWAIKAAYSRTSQFIYQLSQSLISLPTDQWIPIVGAQKPPTADKIAIGTYWNPYNFVTFSAEAYMKWMHNIIEFRDEYYLVPPSQVWNQRTVAGSGRARGIDLKIAREYGVLSGHISYSLLFADRLFAEKNEGKRYPARFDNRHKINAVLTLKMGKSTELSASWIGMSGNRLTLPTQMWQQPTIDNLGFMGNETEVRVPINNYRLPFDHRLDISVTVNTTRGYWNLSVYNVYAQASTVAVHRTARTVEKVNPNYNPSMPWVSPVIYESQPTFVKYKLLPIIPSISYTWLF